MKVIHLSKNDETPLNFLPVWNNNKYKNIDINRVIESNNYITAANPSFRRQYDINTLYLSVHY
jgi:hypothetical protein